MASLECRGPQLWGTWSKGRSRSALGPRGRPSTLSATLLRWISSVPPEIDAPRLDNTVVAHWSPPATAGSHDRAVGSGQRERDRRRPLDQRVAPELQHAAVARSQPTRHDRLGDRAR